MSLLVLLLLIPFLGAIACAFTPKVMVRSLALVASLATLAVGIFAAVQFYSDTSATGDVRLAFTGDGVHSIGFAFRLGVNAIGLWLMILTVGITPLAIAASFESIKEREREYYGWM